jgi:alpha-L-rhamnosidase
MSRLSVAKLRCESLENPIGIERQQPRFSWIVESEAFGAVQTAYQIEVTDGDQVIWDSGKVASNRTYHIAYAGQALSELHAYTWRVRVWDNDDQVSANSETAQFVTAFKPGRAWRAQWISYPIRALHQSPHFRTNFSIDKEVASAYVAFTAKGICDVFLNGQRVTEDYLNPGWTDYFKRNHYRVYDVKDLLGSGAQHFGAIVAEGWYKGQVGNHHEGIYMSRLHFLAELHVTYTDGSTQIVKTDDNWEAEHGAYLSASIMHGEHMDARLELPDWCNGGTEGDWIKVDALPADDPREWHGGKKEMINLSEGLCAHPGDPVRVIKELPALAVSEAEPGNYIYDFGQNMAGIVRLNLELYPGACVRLRYAEMITPDDKMYVENLRSAKATDVYICASNQDVYQSRFTFHGFRYLEITGIAEPLPLEAVTALALGSDTPDAGEFSCSNEMLNQLQSNIRWTQRANFLEVPTDCPQRDERLGWTGDAQVFIGTACANADVEAFFRKWLNDMIDSQREDGTLPNVIPATPMGGNADAAWGDAITVCPTELYKAYGDPEILREWYPRMKAFCEYYQRTLKDDGTRGGTHCFGDWLALDVEDFKMCSGGTPKELVQTAFHVYSHRLTAEAARYSDDQAGASELDAIADKGAEAFTRVFFDGKGKSHCDTQTSYVLALFFDLLPEEQREAAATNLVENIKRNNNHLTTGFVGVSYLLPCLAKFGALDVAYTLLENKTFPSWGYSVENGATTIWERWNGWVKGVGPGDANMNSYSHYAYGSVGAFMYGTVAGLSIEEVGYKKARIAPRPGGTLTKASYEHDSIVGHWSVAWEKQAEDLQLSFAVPANTSAQVSLPVANIEAIQLNGEALNASALANDIQVVEGNVEFEVKSGNYTCAITSAVCA